MQLISLLAAAAVAAQSPSPDAGTLSTARVRYADLDLNTAKDRGRFEHRVAAAVRSLCTDDISGSLVAHVDAACTQTSLERAREQMDRAIGTAAASASLRGANARAR